MIFIVIVKSINKKSIKNNNVYQKLNYFLLMTKRRMVFVHIWFCSIENTFIAQIAQNCKGN